jgi:hypothetical protein
MVTTVSSSVMETKKAEEVGRVTAAGSRAVASARDVVMARLAEKEKAPTPEEKAAIEATVEAARVLVRAEEHKLEAAIDGVTNKWDGLIEQRTR